MAATRYVCPFCGEDYSCPRAACCGEVGHLEPMDAEPAPTAPTDQPEAR